MSGLTENNFVSENSGRVNSNTPTFVVLKVPFEVRHSCGAILSFHGMCLLLSQCTKSRSPSDPLSSSTRHKSFDFLAFFVFRNSYDSSRYSVAFNYLLLQFVRMFFHEFYRLSINWKLKI